MIFLLLACASHKTPHSEHSGQDSPATDSSDKTPGILYVSSYFGGAVHRYEPGSGAPLTPIAGVPGAQTVVQRDGRLVLVAEQSNAILLADPDTGALTGTLIADDPGTGSDETGGLLGPTAAIFGPDALWYVASFNTDAVLRYDENGAFVDVFVESGADGLDGPDIGMTFDREGRLLVPGYESNAVHVFGADGAAQAQLLTQADGLLRPRGVIAGEDGRIWVASRGSGAVIVRATDGSLSELRGTARPAGLALHNGELLVSSEADNTVRAYDAETGAELGVRVEDAAIDGVTSVVVW